MLWTTNGVAVCKADSSQTAIDITSEIVNGAIITWRDKRNGLYHDIYAQKVNLNGTCAWQLNGIAITTAPLTQTNPNICGDGAGGAIISWQDSTTGNWDIKAQRVDANGTLLWNTGGNIVSDATNLQTNPKNLPDGKGGCIFVWKDLRNGINNDIYAQHFNVYGIESYNIMENKYYINLYPNPVSDNVHLEFNNLYTNNKYFVNIFDVFGKIITNFETENNNYILSVKDFNNGLYIIKVYNQKNLVYINKFCVKK